LLLKINQLGTTVILATHAADLVNQIKKRVVTIEDGKITMQQEKGDISFKHEHTNNTKYTKSYGRSFL